MEVTKTNRKLRYIMLIYAARDRARVREYPVPHNRIAVWTKKLYDSCDKGKSWKHKLAEALLLASLDIFSEVGFTLCTEKYMVTSPRYSWQSNLRIAQEIIKCRGIVDGYDGDDPEHYFLIRWFSRLDIFGSLSDLSLGSPLPLDAYWPWDTTKELKVDCLLGTSRTCMSVLAKIAVVICGRWQSENEHHCGFSKAESLKLLLCLLDYPEANRSSCSDLPTDSVVHIGVLMISNALRGSGKAYLKQLIRGEHCEINVRAPLQYHVAEDAETSSYACMLLPMFLAGTLTQDERSLELITTTLERLTKSGMWRVSSPSLHDTALHD